MELAILQYRLVSIANSSTNSTNSRKRSFSSTVAGGSNPPKGVRFFAETS